MWSSLFIVLPLFLNLPELSVTWSNSETKSVRVAVTGEDEVVKQCLRSGLKVRYRFELQLCRDRVAWFDRCVDEKTLLQQVEYDPISETYKVEIDQIGDGQIARTLQVRTIHAALRTVSSLRDLALITLGKDSEKIMQSKSAYLSVRVHSDCKGDYNETIARISNLLSLGLINLAGFDSGWVDFRLQRDK